MKAEVGPDCESRGGDNSICHWNKVQCGDNTFVSGLKFVSETVVLDILCSFQWKVGLQIIILLFSLAINLMIN